MSEELKTEWVTVTTKYLEKTWSHINELELKIETLEHLVEDWLPQIGMTMTFREMFYEIIGTPLPEWYGDNALTRTELEWIRDHLHRKEKLE